MRLRGPAGREPATTLGREDERVALRAGECEAAGIVGAAVPDVEVRIACERARHRGDVADEPDLGDAQQLAWGERALGGAAPDVAMRDQLEDAAGRIVEVARERVPE